MARPQRKRWGRRPHAAALAATYASQLLAEAGHDVATDAQTVVGDVHDLTAPAATPAADVPAQATTPQQ